jgi:hypothetical protein
MEVQTRYNNKLAETIARVFGQQGNVRTVYGRQLMYIDQNIMTAILPAKPTVFVQNHDTASASYGADFFMLGLDGLGNESNSLQ